MSRRYPTLVSSGVIYSLRYVSHSRQMLIDQAVLALVLGGIRASFTRSFYFILFFFSFIVQCYRCTWLYNNKSEFVYNCTKGNLVSTRSHNLK